MMNLEKMKQKKRTITKSRVKKSLLAATTFLCLTTPLLQTQTAYAAENTTPAITIEKPDGWKQGETTGSSISTVSGVSVRKKYCDQAETAVRKLHRLLQLPRKARSQFPSYLP